MKSRLTVTLVALLLAACESFPIPTSTTNPPPPGAATDMSCMQDCLGENTNAEICHARCAK